MSGLNKEQKSLLNSFIRVTNASSRDAVSCLTTSYWNLEPAINLYFSGDMGKRSKPKNKALHDLYLKYEDSQAKKIMADGIIQFCEDIGVDPTDVVMIVICWHMNAQTMGELSEDEFEGGLDSIGVDSIDSLKKKIPELKRQLDDESKFKRIYEYAFTFSCESNQKCLQLDVAVSIWPLLITSARWKYIDQWCEFLEKKHRRAISKDTWVQLLDFVNSMDNEFSQYDPNDAWPYLIDDFVEEVLGLK